MGYDDEKIQNGTAALLNNYPHNRLVKHLMEIAALHITALPQKKFCYGPLGMPRAFIAGMQC